MAWYIAAAVLVLGAFVLAIVSGYQQGCAVFNSFHVERKTEGVST